jgi:uncharacterized protein
MRTFFAAAAFLFSASALAQDSTRADWLRNPGMGVYQGYAAYKVANYAQARVIWETLATLGNGDALFNLAALAEDGLGEAKDMKKAETLYTSAANAGNFKSQYRLGLLYSAGTLLTKDDDKARYYLSLAAAQGDKDAQAKIDALGKPTSALSAFQSAEMLSAVGEHAQAAAAYTTLADAGDTRAQTRLAWMYESGRGVARSLSEAARRFQIAADAGEAEAQYAIAVMLATGKGLPRDRAVSKTWLARAAQQKYPAAVSALAMWEE